MRLSFSPGPTVRSLLIPLLFLAPWLFFAPLLAHAQAAALVRDLETGTLTASSHPSRLQTFEGTLYFTAETPTTGRELWVQKGDGPPEILLDFCPGPCSGAPRPLGGLGNFLILSGGGLWRTDGTPDGTHRFFTGTIHGFLLLPESLVFLTCTDSEGCRVWKSDGTAEGTQPVADLTPGDSPFDTSWAWVGSAGPNLFMLEIHYRYGASRLWVSDGTAAGTKPIREMPGTFLIRWSAPRDQRLLFVAGEGKGKQDLWSSDGTAAGTLRLTDFPADSFEPSLRAFLPRALGREVLLIADDGEHGYEIWTSDGTPGGTLRITDFAEPDPFLGLAALAEAGERIVFLADDGNGLRLWSAAGNPARVRPLRRRLTVSLYTGLVRSGGRVYFRADDGEHGYELWRTDGTPAGTVMTRDICPGPCDSQVTPPWDFAGRAAVLARDPVHGLQAWSSDGTRAGTRRLTDVPDGALSPFTFEIAALEDRLFFPAEDEHGEELWSTGTNAPGGRLEADLALLGISSNPMELTPVGDRLVFTACTGGTREVWATTGSAETTVQLTPSGARASCDREYSPRRNLTATRRQVFFWPDWRDGSALWATDGTLPGTRAIPLDSRPDVYTQKLVAWGGKALFPLSSSPHLDLWSSNGTVAGTHKAFTLPAAIWDAFEVMVPVGRDLFFGGEGLFHTDGLTSLVHPLSAAARFGTPEPRFTRAGSLIFFIAHESGQPDSLWRTDGTAAGTWRLTHQDLALYEQEPSDLTEHNGQLFFFANLLVGGRGLWRTDGTEAGTMLVRSFLPEPVLGDDDPPEPESHDLTSFAGHLFFSAKEEVTGRELWISDGTPERTRVLLDILPGLDSAAPTAITAAEGRLWFAALDSTHGRELWTSDGTPEGTALFQDIAPGEESSAPESLTPGGSRLWFTADDGQTGREVWMLPLLPLYD